MSVPRPSTGQRWTSPCSPGRLPNPNELLQIRLAGSHWSAVAENAHRPARVHSLFSPACTWQGNVPSLVFYFQSLLHPGRTFQNI